MFPRTSSLTSELSFPPFVLALAAGMAAILWSYMPAGQFLEVIELKSIDARFAARPPRPASDKVAIVAIDDDSLARIGAWPWPRDRHAALLSRLSRAGAQAVAFDIILSEPDVDKPESDLTFIKAVERFDNVFQALAMPTGDSSRALEPPEPGAARAAERFALTNPVISPGTGLDTFAELHATDSLLAPFERLSEASRGAGVVDVAPSPDGVYRGLYPILLHEGKLYPSFSLAVAAFMLGRSGDEVSVREGRHVQLGASTRIPIDRSGAMMIDFVGPGHSFPIISAAEVLGGSGEIADDAVRGKVVLVGVTATGLQDIRPTPFDPVARGVEVQAHVIDSILTGSFVRRQRPEVALLTAILWSLLVSLLMWSNRARVYVPVGAMCIAAHCVAANWMFARTGLIVATVVPCLAMTLSLLAGAGLKFMMREREHEVLVRILSQFVPPEIARNLSDEKIRPTISGERRPVSVLFTDLRNFTAASDRIGAEQTVNLLNRYFGLMHEVIFEFGGTLDKFVGDEIMAFFNAPAEQIDHAHLAVACALEMQKRIDNCRAEWEFHGVPDLAAGVGINTGEAIVGYVGSGERMQYTVIGKTVNLASRLQVLGRDLGTRVLIAEDTYQLVKDLVACRDLGSHELRGIPDRVPVYEVLGMRSGADDEDPPPSGSDPGPGG